MSALADEVLPLIRTRADLYRWSAANAHGAQMHEAVTILRDAALTQDPEIVLDVTQKAIASALKVIMRADDSSGIIGDACRALLDLHPQVAARARPPVAKLVDWMMTFQFDSECDYFHLDLVAYAPALGEKGIAAYRARLADLEARLGIRPSEDERWTAPYSHDWFTLDWNAQRLAVLDRDVEAIIRTHARDRKVAHGSWTQPRHWRRSASSIWRSTGRGRRSTVGPDHQSLKAGEYWCTLLAEHRPVELLAARLEVFRRWPSSTTAARLYRDAVEWPQHRDEVMQRLAASPRDAVLFALLSLKDVQLRVGAGPRPGLGRRSHVELTWSRRTRRSTPLAVLPVLNRLVLTELVETGAQHYQIAARRLKKMRTLAAGSEYAPEIDHFIAELREANRRRPRLQQEFDRAGLP